MSDELMTLLESADPDVQAERIKQLLRAATSPVWVVTLTYDPRSDRFEFSPVGDVPVDVCYLLIERARQSLLRAEREAAVRAARAGEASE